MATEKRLLIDLQGVNMDEVDTSDCTDVEDILSAVITYLSEQPVVDAVEVVRCKDCKYYRPPFCLLDDNKHGWLNHVLPEHFCSYGERRC